MPTYQFSCQDCTEITEQYASFADCTSMKVTCQCGGATKKLISAPYLSVNARPTNASAVNVAGALKNEKSFTRDMSTYKTLRQQGIQPERLKGIHDISEKARDVFEIQSGENMSPAMVRTSKEVKATMDKYVSK